MKRIEYLILGQMAITLAYLVNDKLFGLVLLLLGAVSMIIWAGKKEKGKE